MNFLSLLHVLFEMFVDILALEGEHDVLVEEVFTKMAEGFSAMLFLLSFLDQHFYFGL